ncbi:AMP-binding protein [Rugamonas sp.]|uniref:AMP-binding protein n=1 Tax=Rugamonas sp. TaxID=1926287 RepID=UPI0025F71CAD|nr:AMP-binding protein [Rugamonas sp.]
MLDTLSLLSAATAARRPASLVGWRAGAAVDNADFVARVRAWHGLLRRQAGRDFALYLDDSIEFGAAMLGAWQAGKTIWLSADTLAASCAALRLSVDGFLGQFPAALLPLMPAAGDDVGDDDRHALNAALAPDFPALVVFTSGSTGAAQAIPKKISQLASEVATLDALFGAIAGDAAVIATVSHQHIYGLLFKVLWPLCAGRAIHALSVAYPEQLAPALAAGPCVLVASPAHLKRLPAHLDWSGAARTLRAVFSSGGPLPPETAHGTGALLGKVPVEVYGSSETGGVAWRQRGGDIGLGETWLPFPTVDWRIGSDDGLLAVRSPHLPDDRWLTLADRAAPAAAGRLLLLGRSDRVVKIEEKRISLDAMEAALIASSLAQEARVVLCDPAAGERQKLAAFIVPTAAGRAALQADGKLALNARLRAALAAVVEAVALPRRWRYLDQLPVNAQGKTTLAALLALLDDDDDGTAGAAPPAPAPRLPHLRELELELERDAAARPRRVLLELTAPANLFYFDGHFGAAPILPGVVQVEWAIHYGRHYFDLPARFRAIHALKFQQVILPDSPVRLELLHDADKGSLQFRYLSAGGQHASGRIMLGDDDV